MRSFQFRLIVVSTVLASAVVWILQLIFLALFFSQGQPYGSLSDLASAVMVLLILPYALYLHRRLENFGILWHIIAFITIFVGVTLVAAPSAMMVSGSIAFEQSLLPSLIGFGLIGIWLLIVNIALRTQPTWSVRVSWLGIAAGIGLLLLAIGSVFGDQQIDVSGLTFSDPFIIAQLAGTVIGLLGYPVWAILLWRWLVKLDAT